jgi:hypothetical protein
LIHLNAIFNIREKILILKTKKVKKKKDMHLQLMEIQMMNQVKMSSCTAKNQLKEWFVYFPKYSIVAHLSGEV